jgi:endonuclease/exonuclease/phosphatase family metal-dependent hydrolase
MVMYSWNMLFRNTKLPEALTFIRESAFDVFCLQEVPEEFLEKLSAEFPMLSYAVETSRIHNGEVSRQYLVTLSRHPIRQTTASPITTRAVSAPYRASLFTKLMVALRLWAYGVGDREYLYTDIEVDGTMLRIYNLHLPLKHPSWRMEEFELALANRDHTVATVVCGDFNVIESPHIAILNWFLGGSLSDALLYTRERLSIEKKFVEYALQNPLRGKNTHPLSRSQLDHILVSRELFVREASVIPRRFGSDHHPIRVICDTATK